MCEKLGGLCRRGAGTRVCGPNACLFRHCWRPNPEKQLSKTWISRLCVLISNAQRRRLNVVWTPRHSKGQKHFGKNVQDCMLLWFAADTPTVRPPVNHWESNSQHMAAGAGGWRAGERPAPLHSPPGRRSALHGQVPGKKGKLTCFSL